MQKKTVTVFLLQNLTLCVLFGLALLAGGIVNCVYAADPAKIVTMLG